MYLAQLNAFQTQAPFYINILQNLIKGNERNEDKANIDSAINEAVEIAKGNKNVFMIDNYHYFFITTLLSFYKDSLLKIDSNNIQSQTYSEILKILE